MPFLTISFLVGRFGSPTKLDYRKEVGALILTSLLEDLEVLIKLSPTKHI